MDSLVDLLIELAESKSAALRGNETNEKNELMPSLPDGQDWQALYRKLLAEYRPARQEEAARLWAWERTAAAWHRLNAPHATAEACAGCGAYFGSEPTIDIIPQRVRVHAGGDYGCLVEYGRLWRKAAAEAIGIPRPDEERA